MTGTAGAPVRVLHLCPDTRHLGELFSLYRQALDEPPFVSTVVFLRGRPEPEISRALGDRAVFLGLSRGQLEGLRLPALWRLWRWSRTQPRFDVLIAHRFKALTLGLRLRRLGVARQVFGVVHELGQFAGHRRHVLCSPARTQLTLLGVSETVRLDLLRRFPHFPPERVRALPNAVCGRPCIERGQALALLRLSPQRFWYGSVGRLVGIKGYDLLLRAFALLAQELSDVGLALIGAGSEEGPLRALCDDLGIGEQVAFCGWRSDARSLLSAFDVCVFPSREEGFGLAIAEAMAAGRPLIASQVGGIPEVVEQDALLVPPDDAHALTQAMRRLHGDAALRDSMGAALHARWQARFAPDQFTQRLQGYVRESVGLAA
jgi:glycosyltransferase involved in cell wall biosynthesis